MGEVNKVEAKTPREMEAALKSGYRDPIKIDALYQARSTFVEELRERGEVTLDDVLKLDRLGRCVVASEMLLDCTEEAATALIHDEHHAVRSCALLNMEFRSVSVH